MRLSWWLCASACWLVACADDNGETATGAGGAAGSAGVTTGGNADSACDGSEVDTSALVFDGVDDHVAMGVAPELGLTELTLEAWVRRDGRGVDAGTGVGGIRLIPIIAKGRGESDGSNVDCNYAFGFYGDVLGADFEDMATGANHPVMGTTAVGWGEWHHVAVSYDGTTWRLYVDGALDNELAANATPRSDSIQHFSIGTTLESTGTPAGFFQGAIDEVRVWNHARSEADIAAGMYRTIVQETGLVGRWALDQDGSDSAGSNPGTIVGATFATPGAVLDLGEPPLVTLTSPADQRAVTGESVDLEITIDDPDDDAFVVTFHVRDVSEGEDFSVVVLPDTQYYTVQGSGYEHYFYDQTQWILDNFESYNITGVIHNGDLVEHGDDFDYEWNVANTAMSPLEAALPRYPDGVPYGVSVGNHDQEPIGTPGGTTKFNQNFGVARFEGRAYYGGSYGGNNDESWFSFAAGGLDFVVVNLQYRDGPEIDPLVLSWARTIFDAHPDAFGILNSHYLTNGTATFGAYGQAIYNALRDVDNVQVMTCGHVSAESLRSDDFEGNVIHTMLADYQFRENGGAGWMRIWEFSPANNELTVRTYSPTLDQFETDADSEYTLEVDLSGAGGTFGELATVDPAGATVSATMAGLESGHRYEWYVTVSDCAHTVESPLQRFTHR